MGWSWMDVESVWISPSPRDPTPQPLASTWADPHMVAAAAVVEEVVVVEVEEEAPA